MTENDFWGIIELTKSSEDMFDRPVKLKDVLKAKSPEEVQAFAEAYTDYILKAYTWPLWGAAYVICGGCSDDGFDYFRDWLISEGETTYNSALADPESLAQLEQLDEPELEDYRYVPYDVYKELTGKELSLKERPFPPAPQGEAWDEETVYELYPKLVALYG